VLDRGCFSPKTREVELASTGLIERKSIEPTAAPGRQLLGVQVALKTKFDKVLRDQVGSVKDMASSKPS
jgi:hypothetical protein